MSTSAYSPTSAARSQPDGAALKYPDVRNYISGRFVAGGDRVQDINNPADGSVIAIDPDIPSARQRVAFEARAAAPGSRWILNDVEVGPASAPFLWQPRRGTFTLQLLDETSRLLATVSFEVRGA